MREIKIFELFSGIGSPRKALDNIGVKYKSLGYSEINKKAIRAYCLLNGDEEKNNMGDITKIKKIPENLDLLIHGSPCQDFSKAGLSAGGEKGQGTRSSLMWETIRLVNDARPKMVVWENVKTSISGKHKNNFEKYLKVLDEMGYKSKYKVLNAKDFGVAQNRERVFVISTLGDENNFKFENLQKKETPKLEQYISFEKSEGKKAIEKKHGKFISMNCKTSKRGYFGKDYLDKRVYDLSKPAVSIVTTNNPYYTDGEKIKKMNALESFRLMGFSKGDYETIKNISSESGLIKLAGNTIVVNVLEEIFKEMFKGEK